jgi:hypothetical protein
MAFTVSVFTITAAVGAAVLAAFRRRDLVTT